MENFNLKKFLVENKLTTNSRVLNEISFDYNSDILAVVNALIDMGTEGQKVLNILEKIPAWNDLVESASNEADFDFE